MYVWHQFLESPIYDCEKGCQTYKRDNPGQDLRPSWKRVTFDARPGGY